MAAYLEIALFLCAGIAATVYGLGVVSTLRHVRRRRMTFEGVALPPVSLLKPIKGVEESLEANLESVFSQRYPELEILFAATDSDDPGLAVARRVAAKHPHVPVRFVIADPSFGLNPKVANLAAALRAASHDLVLQTDANVQLSPDYLRSIVAELESERASVLTSLVVGDGERSVGAALENLQLGAFIVSGMCAALYVARVTCVCGKAMLFRKSELEALGGFESVRDVLCEDFVLGRAYEAAGKRILLSATPVTNVNERIRVRQMLARHSRWMKMRAVLHLPGFLADLFSTPTLFLLAAFFVSGADPRIGTALAVVVALKIACDGLLVRLSRGHGMKLRYLALSPLKDLAMAGVFVHAIFSRTVVWRGVRLRFGKDTVLKRLPASERSDAEVTGTA